MDEKLAAVRSNVLATVLAPGGDPAALRRCALSTLLRRWRASIEPAHVDLPVRARRRPGLTRADVAELAGLSVCWYTLLETGGYGRTCSPRAIERVATALRLDRMDRALLQLLASPEAFRSMRVLFAGWSEIAA